MTFKEGAIILGMGALAGGVTSLSSTTLSLGAHTITAEYGGDAGFTSSTSSDLAQVIKTATSLVVVSSANPSALGQSVTFTASISVIAPGVGSPTGTITFKDGATDIGTSALAGAEATFSTTALAAGHRIVTAVYAGDVDLLPATSPDLVQVNTASTATVLESAPNASVFGEPVALTAVVAGFGGGAPSGSVAFMEGAEALGTTFLNDIGVGHPIAAGSTHACALSGAGGVVCWGHNQRGQLGDGTTTDSYIPVPVSGLASGVVGIFAGNQFTCVLTNLGGVKCWGGNSEGALGDGTTTLRTTPVDVIGLTSGVRAVGGGSNHTCALMITGGVKCWGFNAFGQLGDGSTSNRTVPVDVGGLTDVQAIAVGGVHTCALASTGGVKCWGRNVEGQLGDGTTIQRTTPTDVSGLTGGVRAVGAGSVHTCALTAAGEVKCWGSNLFGQIGDGSTTNRLMAVDVLGLADVNAIYPGRSQTCALTSVGGVKCWGRNLSGDVGDGTTIQREIPVDVVGLANGISVVVPGYDFTCALAIAGSLKCWGLNQFGQVGDGTTANHTTPADVPGFSALVYANAKLTTRALAVGNHTIKVEYGGDAGHDPSTSPDLAQTVAEAEATTSLGSSARTSVFGESVTFTATVSAVSLGSGTPSGTVTFMEGGTDLSGPVSLNGSGLATFETSSLGLGPHTITAVYGGDSNFTTSTSADLSQVVDQSATATTLVPSVSPSVFGQSVTFTATVAATLPGSGTPTGTVTFSDGAGALDDPVTLDGSGVASLSTSALSAGSHTISAVYGGDTNFTTSTSTGLSQTVSTGATTTALQSSPSPSVSGQSVTLTATVAMTAPGAGTAGGSVTFKDGATTVGTKPLTGGAATFTTSSLAVGSHTLTAVYGGDGSFAGSTSSGVTQSVGKGATTTTLAALPTIALPGLPISLTATVAVQAPATSAPAGNMVFKEGPKILSTVALASGKATFATSALTIGAHTITASYGGSAKLTTSVGTKTVTVDPKVGAEFRVNTATAGAQQQPSIAKLSTGGFVAVWESNLQDGSGLGIYGQRYNSAGAKAGVELRINTTTTRAQSQPSVAALAGGTFVVVWTAAGQDGSGSGIYGQRFNAAGVKTGNTEFRVNTTVAGAQSLPAVATLQDGSFVVAWSSAGQDGSGLGIYAQRFTATGAKSGGEVRVNTTIAGAQSDAAVAALTGGGFVVAWDSVGQDGSGLGVYGQRFSPTGVAAGAEFRVNTTVAGAQSLPSVAALNNGGFVVAWESPDAAGSGIFGQRYNTAGAKAGGQTQLNTTTVNEQRQPSVSGFADGGGFLATWTSTAEDGSGRGVYGQGYDAAGRKLDVEFRLNTATANDQWEPSLATLANRTFVAAWASGNQDGSLEGVYAQRFNLNR